MGPLHEISADHVARYELAATVLNGIDVLDVACGCGYGSWILHEAGFHVTGVDIEPKAIAYARKNYPGPIYTAAKAEKMGPGWDCVVSFETLEHLADPEGLIARLEASEIIASVPNQERYPFDPKNFAEDEYPHLRHYTPDEFRALLKDFRIVGEYCQLDKRTKAIFPGLDGRYMILHGRR